MNSGAIESLSHRGPGRERFGSVTIHSGSENFNFPAARKKVNQKQRCENIFLGSHGGEITLFRRASQDRQGQAGFYAVLDSHVFQCTGGSFFLALTAAVAVAFLLREIHVPIHTQLYQLCLKYQYELPHNQST